MQSHLSMRLQTLSSRGFIAVVSCFAAGIFLAIIIGAVGPNVLEYHSVSTWQCHNNPSPAFNPQYCTGMDLGSGETWTGVVSGVDRLNQQIVMRAELNSTTSYDLVWEVDISGRFNGTDAWILIEDGEPHTRSFSCDQSGSCTSLTLVHLPFIHYNDYQFEVTLKEESSYPDSSIVFEFEMVNDSFTLWELWFRFVCLLFAFGVTMAFAYTLRATQWYMWTVEQKWTILLLFGVIGFDNPFFSLTVLADGWFPVFLDQVLAATFIAFLLLFWIIMFDGLRKYEAEQRSWARFYAPKFAYVGIMWLATLTVFMWTELHELDDPQYNTIYDVHGFVFFLVVSIVMALGYLGWLFYLVFRACSDSRTMPYLSRRTKFFGLFTLFVIVITVSGIVFGLFGPVRNSAGEFAFLMAVLNDYVFVLAFVYSPSIGGPAGVAASDSVIDLTDAEGDGSYGHLDEDDDGASLSMRASYDGDDVDGEVVELGPL